MHVSALPELPERKPTSNTLLPPAWPQLFGPAQVTQRALTLFAGPTTKHVWDGSCASEPTSMTVRPPALTETTSRRGAAPLGAASANPGTATSGTPPASPFASAPHAASPQHLLLRNASTTHTCELPASSCVTGHGGTTAALSVAATSDTSSASASRCCDTSSASSASRRCCTCRLVCMLAQAMLWRPAVAYCALKWLRLVLGSGPKLQPVFQTRSVRCAGEGR